jgi:flagellum-specific ATP synthase
MPDATLSRFHDGLLSGDLHRARGRVTNLIGLVIEATGLRAEVGELCTVTTGRNRPVVPAEVVGFREGRTLLMPLGEMHGIGPGTPVSATGGSFRVPVGRALLGRVLDGLGRPIDDGPPVTTGELRSAAGAPPSPMARSRIDRRLELGVRALDTLVPCGRGQRLGIFAGSGVGKSTLLGMIAGSTQASVNVICLVGERGRELLEFIERDLGSAIERSVVVVATSDQPALIRIKAALVATTLAEHFRDQGEDVLLMMDSVTRLAMAQREIGLAIGEPPATRGYTPSVFALLPRLLERAGTSDRGSITGLYTVLVEGDDMNEPVADAARSILDGHCVLTRELAHRNHYPAIDVLQSVSRLADEITSGEVRAAAGALRETLAAHRAKEDLISIGAYTPGADPQVDYAIAKLPSIDRFLRQARPSEDHPATPAGEADEILVDLMADRAAALHSTLPQPITSTELTTLEG